MADESRGRTFIHSFLWLVEMIRLPRLPAEHAVTADDFNRLAAACLELQQQLLSAVSAAEPQITAAFPVEVRRRPGGWHLSLAYEEQAAVVELTSTLSLGGEAYARVLWHVEGDWTEAETAELTVHDALGTFEGNPGDRALVRFDRQSGQWIVWQLQC